jgi:hypothetical protein
MHPGGIGVLADQEVAGKDATTVFYSLHRSEILQRPQYQRLKIGQIEGQSPKIHPQLAGELSRVSLLSEIA